MSKFTTPISSILASPPYLCTELLSTQFHLLTSDAKQGSSEAETMTPEGRSQITQAFCVGRGLGGELGTKFSEKRLEEPSEKRVD